MTRTEAARVPPSDWRVEFLRLTLFPSNIPEGSDDWFSQLVGEPPDATVSHPKTGSRRDELRSEGRYLALEISPTRIDLRLSADPTVDIETEVPLELGPFPEAKEYFCKLAQKWFSLETCPSSLRIAFGGVVVLPTDDRTSGYKQLQAYLPAVRLDPDASSDFSYRINRPRRSRSDIPDLLVNRLNTWSVRVIQRSMLTLRPNEASQTLGPQHRACRLEFDINTASEYDGEFSPDVGQTLFAELVDLAEEIIRDGDSQ